MPRFPLRLFCAALAVASLFVAAAPAHAVSPVDILRFNALVELSAEDRITVTEEIMVDVPTSGTNHGIYRDIPINSRWKDRGRQKVDFKVRAVRIDGKDRPADDVESIWPFQRVYLRDRDAFLSAGVHQFVLKYEMTQQIGFFEQQDELTWNVTGSGWDGIESSMCTVLPPPGADFTDHRAWLGLRGSKDSFVQMGTMDAGGRNAFTFKANRPIRPGEDFTVAVAWPKGFVKATDPAGVEKTFTLWLSVLLAISLAASWFIWYRFGKDPESGPAIPLFYPPAIPSRLQRGGRGGERLSAAAVNYAWNKGKVTSRGLAGLLISLAERGDCKIHGDAKHGFVIQGIQSTSPIPEERKAAGMFGREIRLDKAGGPKLFQMKNTVAAQLRKDYEGQWKQNLVWTVVMFLPALVGLFLLLRWHLGPFEMWASELVDNVLVGLGGVVSVGALFSYLSKFKGFVRIMLMLAGVLPAVLMIGLLYMLLFDDEVGLLWLFSPLQFALMAAVLAAPVLFAPFMDAPSLEASKLRQDIAGLAMYIGAAETARLNYANPPDRPLELYHRLLPYAVALGLEQAWGERFAGELASMEADVPPTQAFLNSSSLLTSLVRDADSSLTSYVSTLKASSRSSGSSFGGGGGGAGSGGGGGGGGAC